MNIPSVRRAYPVLARLGLVLLALGLVAVFSPRSANAAPVSIPVGNPNWFCDMSYSGAECPTTVGQGDMVTWKFPSGAYHTTTECRGSTCDDVSPPNPTPLWDSGLRFGGTYSYTFTSPGIYYYMCNFHGYGLMRGKITVTSSVGGIAELPGADAAPLERPASTGSSPWAIAAIGLGSAAGAIALAASAAWYARRRSLS